MSCPPSTPPYALLPLYQYIARHTPVTCKVHVHSSASAMATGEMRNFMGRCGVSSQQHSGPAQLKITLVWKSGVLGGLGALELCLLSSCVG